MKNRMTTEPEMTQIERLFNFIVRIGNTDHVVPVSRDDFNLELSKPKYTSPIIQHQYKGNQEIFTFVLNK